MCSRIALSDNKAGMQNLDTEKINQIMYEASKGSKFFENEVKKDEEVNKKIAEQKKRISKITETELTTAEKKADEIIKHLEQVRNLNKTIVHIDMDAFYAAVETRDNPSLKDKPMAVGSSFMLSTSNYIARRFGVRAAMPGFIAKKLCSQLIIIPPNFKKYTLVSQLVHSILVKYDENFCPISLDEAYLDFTKHLETRKDLPKEERTVFCRTCDNFDQSFCLCDPNFFFMPGDELCGEEETLTTDILCNNLAKMEKNGSLELNDLNLNKEKKEERKQKDEENLECKEEKMEERKKKYCPSCKHLLPSYKSRVFGFSADEAVQEMRCRIEQRTQLTASAGIAPNTMLAKICSDQNKPNGQFKLPYSKEAILQFMKDLPIRKVCGIGKVTEKMLQALNIISCSDLYKQRGLLNILYSETSFEYFMQVSLGIGSTQIKRDGNKKSLSTEQTFSEISKPSDLYKKCQELCEVLASDLHNEGLMGRTISIKLKSVDFDVKTRSQSILNPTSDMDIIYQVVCDLIRTEIAASSPKPLRLRLMGVRISNFLPKTQYKKQNTIIDCFIKKDLPLSNPTHTKDLLLSNPTHTKDLPLSNPTHTKDLPLSNPTPTKDLPLSNPTHTKDLPLSNPTHTKDLPLSNPTPTKDLPLSNPTHTKDLPLSNPTHEPFDTISLNSSQNFVSSFSQSENQSSNKIQGHFCPICNRKCSSNLQRLNAHIDKCLLFGQNFRSSRNQHKLLNKEFSENTSISTPSKSSKETSDYPRSPKKEAANSILSNNNNDCGEDLVATKNLFATSLSGMKLTQNSDIPMSPVISKSFVSEEKDKKTSTKIHQEISVDRTDSNLPHSMEPDPLVIESSSLSQTFTENSLINYKKKNILNKVLGVKSNKDTTRESSQIIKSLKEQEIIDFKQNPIANISSEPALSQKVKDTNEGTSKESSQLIQSLKEPECFKQNQKTNNFSVPALSQKDKDPKNCFEIFRKSTQNSVQAAKEDPLVLQKLDLKKNDNRKDSISPLKQKPILMDDQPSIMEEQKKLKSLPQSIHYDTEDEPMKQSLNKNMEFLAAQPLDQSDVDSSITSFICPSCNKQMTSNMALFNQHIDLCLNQDIIHHILVDQGEELKKVETIKRKTSPSLKPSKKKKQKIEPNSNKDTKMLTLHSFFS